MMGGGGGAGLRGKRGWAGLFAVGGRRGHGMMMWQRRTNGCTDYLLLWVGPAVGEYIGVGDVYH